MPWTPVRLAPVLVAIACSACNMAHPSDLRPNAMPTPAASGSALPRLHASARGIILSWVEQAGTRATLKFAERTASGWSAPRAVASGEDWFVNWADVPSVIELADGTLAAHWLQKSGPGTYAYDVRLAWSRDRGRTWSAPFSPHDDGTATEHGFVSLVQAPGGGLGVGWLDGRAMEVEQAAPEHAAGDMMLRYAEYDAGWRRVADAPVDARVCECCPTSAASTDEGLLVAYRDRRHDEVRDIHVSRMEGGAWTDPSPVHADEWTIPACPVNGPALAADGRRVAVAWFTARDEQPRAFVAFSTDAGRSFGAAVRVDDAASLGRVGVVLLGDGSALVSHIEFRQTGAEFRVRRVTAEGGRGRAVTVSSVGSGRTSGYPRIARRGRELVMAWTDGSGTSSLVRTATAALE